MMVRKPFEVRAEWDEQASVWIATSEEVPGLCCEGGTFEELMEAVVSLVPELLIENGVVSAPDAAEVPIKVVAERRAVGRPAA